MRQTKKHLQIAFKVATDKGLSPIEFTFEHTEHSYLRARQRGINNQKIVAALQYGENVYKQGLTNADNAKNQINRCRNLLKQLLGV